MTISEMRKNDWCGFVNNVAEYVLGYKWMHCPASHVSCDSAGQLIPPEKQSANWIGWIDGCNPEIPKGHWAYISQTWVEDFAHDVSADYRVLCHVREKWEIDRIFDMTCMLREIWMKRQGSVGSPESFRLFYAYQPGDYAEAALRVVMGDSQN